MSLTVTGTRIYANEEYIIGRARQYAAADASIDALRVTCPGVTADAPPDMVRAAAVGGLTSVVQGLLAIIDRLTEDGQA